MAATTIFFNGRLISVPGSYSEVDASGLEQVGLGASGIVAVLGTAEGGRPVSEISSLSDYLRFTKPEAIRETFRSGNLREVGDFLFAPAKDPNILAGAQEVVAMKVNPATASSLNRIFGELRASAHPAETIAPSSTASAARVCVIPVIALLLRKRFFWLKYSGRKRYLTPLFLPLSDAGGRGRSRRRGRRRGRRGRRV